MKKLNKKVLDDLEQAYRDLWGRRVTLLYSFGITEDDINEAYIKARTQKIDNFKTKTDKSGYLFMLAKSKVRQRRQRYYNKLEVNVEEQPMGVERSKIEFYPVGELLKKCYAYMDNLPARFYGTVEIIKAGKTIRSTQKIDLELQKQIKHGVNRILDASI